MSQSPQSDFEKLASEEASPGLLREFWDFLRFNKKWWLLPMIVVMLGMALLMLLQGTAVAPFIYTLF
ncbi:MAG: DUF5989 family protein [Pirellulales bacterium]